MSLKKGMQRKTYVYIVSLIVIIALIIAFSIKSRKEIKRDPAIQDFINNLSQSKEKCVEILSHEKCYDEKAHVIPCPKIYNESIQKSCEELNK